ncbi:uncharacterized protein PSFLO_04355 [Pseudozyma flocculosa]|uniref:Uncharacterized protein n=1 Tax=Pseudozyma flocculosa TaxID=84751 RepID=A0A5C3F4J4_9BASI|nr:uncharacterized protein PSFLO_04355 [Pseudozyma flocculosa]
MAPHVTNPLARTRNRSSSSTSSSNSSSDDDGCTSDQSDDIPPETGFDPFLAATRRARINSSASSTTQPLAAASSRPSPISSPATSNDTIRSANSQPKHQGHVGDHDDDNAADPEAHRWTQIDAFWSKVVDDTMFRPKQGPIDLSSKGITVILPKIADLSRFVALPPPRYESDPPQPDPHALSDIAHSKSGGLVRHESYLAPFSSHHHNDSSTLGQRAFARSKSAFQPGMRTSHSFSRTTSAMSALSSRSGGSNAAASNSPARFRDPRDRQATLNLFLAQNRLTTLPSAIFQLANLRVLSLRFNQLERLPPAIGELHNLTELNIANNQLRFLPAEILRLRLEVFNWFPNPFLKPPRDGRLTVRPLLSIRAKHARHAQLHRLGRLDETPVRDQGETPPNGGAAAAVAAAAAQPLPIIRIGQSAAGTSTTAAGPGAANRQRLLDRTRSEAQVEGFLASGMGRLGVTPSSHSILEDDGEDSFDADSTAEAITPMSAALASQAGVAPGETAGLDADDDERSRILAAAFEDSGSDDDGDEAPAGLAPTAASNAGWLKGKVEGRSRVLGQKDVAPLPTLQELCVRRLLGAYDTAEAQAQGLVSPFLSPMITAAGGRRRAGSRRNGSKPGTPRWGATPRSSRTLSTRSISFSSSTGSESGLLAKRVPTLLEAYENGTLQSLEGELGRGLVPLLEAARRSATRDWGTKARVSRSAASRKKSGSIGGGSGGGGAHARAQTVAMGQAAGDSDSKASAAGADEAEDRDTFGGIEAAGSLDRGDDACENPWFSRCPNPKHVCEGQEAGLYGSQAGGRPTLALHRSRGYGSSSSVSSLGTTLGFGGAGAGKVRSQHDDDSEMARSVDDGVSSISSSAGRHSPVSQASSTDTLGGSGGAGDMTASASTPQLHHQHHHHAHWAARPPSFSRSNSSSSSSFITSGGGGGGPARFGSVHSFGRQPSSVFQRGFSTSSALSASGLRPTLSRSHLYGGEAGDGDGATAGRDWPLDEAQHMSAPVFSRAGETRLEWISHIAGRKVSRMAEVQVDLDLDGDEGTADVGTGSEYSGDKNLIPIQWRGCSRGCLDFLI